MNILVLNPGGNSLKVEVVSCTKGQQAAFDGRKLLSLGIDGIGHHPQLSTYQGKRIIATKDFKAANYGEAAAELFQWIEHQQTSDLPCLSEIDSVAVRVVHGGPDFDRPVIIDCEVEQQIVALEKLAPLHNKSSIEVLEPLRHALGEVPVYAVFDSAFHRTIPEHAALYALPLELSRKHHIRRYGFHGISHRYLLERYAHLVSKPPTECSLVTMHLESGCSVTAIRNGRSLDNTMGMTPLEGLMMGTRSGDVDPSVLSLLIQEEGIDLDAAMTILNKKSGLLGVSGLSLDTRVLMKSYETNPRVKLAIEMFAYRLMKAVAAQIAVVGLPEAVIFGGGIAENNQLIRRRVADGLHGFGFLIDPEANQELIDKEGRLTLDDSRLAGWVIPAEEGLQMAHECYLAMAA